MEKCFQKIGPWFLSGGEVGWARFRVKAKSGPNCAIVWSGLQIRSYQDDFSGSIVSLHCDDKKVAAHLVYLNIFFKIWIQSRSCQTEESAPDPKNKITYIWSCTGISHITGKPPLPQEILCMPPLLHICRFFSALLHFFMLQVRPLLL